MKEKILFVLFFVAICCSAQTKIIAHKSHSGSKGSFIKFYKKNNTANSSFGLPGRAYIIVLDTVIAVNNSVTLLKKRQSIVCYQNSPSYKKMKKSDFRSVVDTLVNHEYLNRKNKLAFIKKYLKENTDYSNSVESVVFLGFEK